MANWSDKQMRGHKRAQGYISATGATLGIGALGAAGLKTKPASAAAVKLSRKLGGQRGGGKIIAGHKKAVGAVQGLTVGSAGVGGVGGYNFAAIQSQESRRTKVGKSVDIYLRPIGYNEYVSKGLFPARSMVNFAPKVIKPRGFGGVVARGKDRVLPKPASGGFGAFASKPYEPGRFMGSRAQLPTRASKAPVGKPYAPQEFSGSRAPLPQRPKPAPGRLDRARSWASNNRKKLAIGGGAAAGAGALGGGGAYYANNRQKVGKSAISVSIWGVDHG